MAILGAILDALENQPAAGRDVLTTQQAADHAGVEPYTIRRWMRDGMPHSKGTGPRGTHTVARADLDAWTNRGH